MPLMLRSASLVVFALTSLEAAALAQAQGEATTRVSVDSAGAEGNGDCNAGRVSISQDGRFVAFDSTASNLVKGDTNAALDVFVYDRLKSTIERVSVDSSGAEANGASFFPMISQNGQVVAFHSKATNLVAGDTNGSEEVFVHDRQSGKTERMGVDSAGAQGNGGSFKSAISADGRFVSFYSYARNLVAGDTNAKPDVFVHDRQLATTERVSVDSAGMQSNDGSFKSSVSADGRFVTFSSYASNMVSGDTNGTWDVFVHDRQTGTTERLSVDSAGAEGNGNSFKSTISGDGRFVAFSSDASNLVAGDTNGVQDVFLRDRQAGTTRRVSVDSAGAESDGASDKSAISGDGRFVAIGSRATNLVSGDTNGFSDVFVHGPYLTLEADPVIAPAGATLTLTTWGGDPNNLVLLVVTDVDGTPMFLQAVLTTFDADGVFTVGALVPSGFSGSVISFESFGIVATGKVGTSNTVTITFQ